MEIRPETLADRDAVRRVNEAAFGQPDEAHLVDRLRERAPAYLGLAAVREGKVVGHIAFTPVTLDPPRPALHAWGLAPMAVLPEHQREGIGTWLVEAGLAALRAEDACAVFVLGHAAYYPRFGFAPAPPRGLRCTYPVPDEVFMALELVPGALDGVTGTVHYDDAFSG
ncbi:MAG TPA: N-acetyltransferase [Rubricoccaceae bacterium]|nr:N-acetyltransferase [Rubricoccaceae bacterium]